MQGHLSSLKDGGGNGCAAREDAKEILEIRPRNDGNSRRTSEFGFSFSSSLPDAAGGTAFIGKSTENQLSDSLSIQSDRSVRLTLFFL